VASSCDNRRHAISTKYAAQRRLVENDHMIETFAAVPPGISRSIRHTEFARPTISRCTLTRSRRRPAGTRRRNSHDSTDDGGARRRHLLPPGAGGCRAMGNSFTVVQINGSTSAISRAASTTSSPTVPSSVRQRNTYSIVRPSIQQEPRFCCFRRVMSATHATSCKSTERRCTADCR
jgi:hypothetical protein